MRVLAWAASLLRPLNSALAGSGILALTSGVSHETCPFVRRVRPPLPCTPPKCRSNDSARPPRASASADGDGRRSTLRTDTDYPSIVEIFKSHQDAISKLDDATLEFLGRVVEPTCGAYKAKKYGQMFDVLGRAGTLQKPSEKQAWADDMKALDTLRESGTVHCINPRPKQKGRTP